MSVHMHLRLHHRCDRRFGSRFGSSLEGCGMMMVCVLVRMVMQMRDAIAVVIATAGAKAIRRLWRFVAIVQRLENVLDHIRSRVDVLIPV